MTDVHLGGIFHPPTHHGTSSTDSAADRIVYVVLTVFLMVGDRSHNYDDSRPTHYGNCNLIPNLLTDCLHWTVQEMTSWGCW